MSNVHEYITTLSVKELESIVETVEQSYSDKKDFLVNQLSHLITGTSEKNNFARRTVLETFRSRLQISTPTIQPSHNTIQPPRRVNMISSSPSATPNVESSFRTSTHTIRPSYNTFQPTNSVNMISSSPSPTPNFVSRLQMSTPTTRPSYNEFQPPRHVNVSSSPLPISNFESNFRTSTPTTRPFHNTFQLSNVTSLSSTSNLESRLQITTPTKQPPRGVDMTLSDSTPILESTMKISTPTSQPIHNTSYPLRRVSITQTPTPNIILDNIPFIKFEKFIINNTDLLPSFEPRTHIEYYHIPLDYINRSFVNSNDQDNLKIYLRIVQKKINEEITERLPNHIKVNVNNIDCILSPLKNTREVFADIWRQNIPIDITNQTIFNCNFNNCVRITWENEPLHFTFGIFMGKKLTHENLFYQLMSTSLYSNKKTSELLKITLSGDVDISVNAIEVTIKDPWSQKRIEVPIRGKNCTHLECFDAKLYLQFNEQKDKWLCPICKKKVIYANIEVDNFFYQILRGSRLSEQCSTIILFGDGKWFEKSVLTFNNRTSSVQTANEIGPIVITSSEGESDDENIQPKVKCTRHNASRIVTLQDLNLAPRAGPDRLSFQSRNNPRSLATTSDSKAPINNPPIRASDSRSHNNEAQNITDVIIID